MDKTKNLKSVKAGVIIAAVSVLIATANLIVASIMGPSVFLWSGLAIFFSTLTILLANLSSYRKKKKQLDEEGFEKNEKVVD